jgi:hypothetical protein
MSGTFEQADHSAASFSGRRQGERLRGRVCQIAGALGPPPGSTWPGRRRFASVSRSHACAGAAGGTRGRWWRSMSVTPCCWCARPVGSPGIFPAAGSGAAKRPRPRRDGNWPGRSAGLTLAAALLPAGGARGVRDGQQDHVTFFELRLRRLPALQLDHREIVAAQLFSPDELRGVTVTGPVAAYLERRHPDAVRHAHEPAAT